MHTAVRLGRRQTCCVLGSSAGSWNKTTKEEAEYLAFGVLIGLMRSHKTRQIIRNTQYTGNILKSHVPLSLIIMF